MPKRRIQLAFLGCLAGALLFALPQVANADPITLTVLSGPALQQSALLDVQAEPQTTVLNNRTANLTAGTQVPIRVIDAGGGAGAATNFPRAQVSMQQTGVILMLIHQPRDEQPRHADRIGGLAAPVKGYGVAHRAGTRILSVGDVRNDGTTAQASGAVNKFDRDNRSRGADGLAVCPRAKENACGAGRRQDRPPHITAQASARGLLSQRAGSTGRTSRGD